MPSHNLVQSVTRALDIIDVVAHADDGIRLQDLAARLGLKATTVHNLARTLVARQYLHQDHRSWYHLGPAIAEISRYYHNNSVQQRATGPMQKLGTRLPSATVVLGELVGADIRLQLRLSPDRPQLMQRPLDQTFSPYANGIGLVYLAFADANQRRAIETHSPFSDLGLHLWRSSEALEAYLQNVRTTGYAVVPFERERSNRLAMPITDHQGQILAAIGISLPPGERPEQELRKALAETVQQIKA